MTLAPQNSTAKYSSVRTTSSRLNLIGSPPSPAPSGMASSCIWSTTGPSAPNASRAAMGQAT